MLTSTCISGGSVTLTQPSWSPLLVDSGPGGANNAIQAQPFVRLADLENARPKQLSEPV
jgi:hypothetical protein